MTKFLIVLVLVGVVAYALAQVTRGGQRGEREDPVVSPVPYILPVLQPSQPRSPGRLRVLERRLNWHAERVRLLRRQVRELRLELAKTRRVEAYSTRVRLNSENHDYWASRQISAAEAISRESGGDPWPNCPDPHDGSGASWYDTVNCENGGNWMDSPGYYRCGLQFDPMWERRFGRLCP